MQACLHKPKKENKIGRKLKYSLMLEPRTDKKSKKFSINSNRYTWRRHLKSFSYIKHIYFPTVVSCQPHDIESLASYCGYLLLEFSIQRVSHIAFHDEVFHTNCFIIISSIFTKLSYLQVTAFRILAKRSMYQCTRC